MRIIPGKYPEDDPDKYLVFIHRNETGISLTFARRLAAYAKSKNRILYLISGHRDYATQKILYEQNVKDHPPHGDGMVAPPGSSWHNGRCAVDVSDMKYWQNYMMLGDMRKTIAKQELRKFGLCVPLNLVDSKTVHEYWHWQPIETIGYKGDRMKFLMPDDKIYIPKIVIPTK